MVKVSKASAAFCLGVVSVLSCPSIGAGEDTFDSQNYRLPDPENILYLETKYGLTIFELTSDFAPTHVARLKELVRAGYYTGAPFYRRIEGFVAQFGQPDEYDAHWSKSDITPMRSEFNRPIDPSAPYYSVQKPGVLAADEGYLNDFAVARDVVKGIEYPIHCPATMNFARGPEHSATTQLAIMTGQAPRHLDNNITQVARIIYGMEHMRQLIILDETQAPDQVISMRLEADIPEVERLKFLIQKADGPAAKERHAKMRDGTIYGDWIVNGMYPKIDVCYRPPTIKLLDE